MQCEMQCELQVWQKWDACGISSYKPTTHISPVSDKSYGLKKSYPNIYSLLI
jgi:hypothetical protein